jgi:putative tryptophan/tyrosine transport system substrate-binding protein
VRRRDFIALAGGLTAAWPLAARAQQDNRVRHIGVFMNLPEGDADGARWIAALLKSLDEFGWTEGRNIRLDIRWGVDPAHVQKTPRSWLHSIRTSSWRRRRQPCAR